MIPTQTFIKENVVEAARRRVSFVFDHFETIHVSVSGGKDSTVLAYLVLEEARRRGRRVGVFFLDEEVVYRATVTQVEYIMEQMAPGHVIPLWLQFPFALTNAVSLTETRFIPWEPGKAKLWMRPKKAYAIKSPPWDRTTEIIGDRNKGLGFYDVFPNFESCYTNAAFLVGLRGVESPNRWRAMVKNPVEIGGERVYWATRRGQNVNMYPIYDWNLHDIWRFTSEQRIPYHPIYDYQLKKGTPLKEMRISSLIHERSFKSLVDLPEFEPDTYNRLVKRAQGIALAQETAKAAKLFRVTKLPKNFTSWRAYRDFLLETHPVPADRDIMARRFARYLDNEYVARQEVRQLLYNDYENCIPVVNAPDPRDDLIAYYREVL